MLVTAQQGRPGSNSEETRKYILQEIFSDFMKGSVMNRKYVRNKQGNGPEQSVLLAITRRYFSTAPLHRKANRHHPHHRGYSDRTQNINMQGRNRFYKIQRKQLKDRKQKSSHKDPEKCLKRTRKRLKQKKTLIKESETGEDKNLLNSMKVVTPFNSTNSDKTIILAIKATSKGIENDSKTPAQGDNRAVAVLSDGNGQGREHDMPGYRGTNTAKHSGELDESLIVLYSYLAMV